MRRVRQINVKIPAGIDDGQILRIPGRGEAGHRGGPPGDLLIGGTGAASRIFRRDGRNIRCEVPVSFVQAALGDEIQVQTLEGKVKIRIPEGTQSGRILRLRNKGIQDVRGQRQG